MNRLLATTLVSTAAYSLTLLAGQPVANAADAGGVTTTLPSVVLSPATEALRDGDDVRAEFLAGVQSDLFQLTDSTLALTPATAALHDGDDIRARALAALSH